MELVYWVFNIVVLVILFFGNVGIWELGNRLYPDDNDQPLVTRCQMDSVIQRSAEDIKRGMNEYEGFDGYILSEEGKYKILVKVVDKRGDEVKIRYNTAEPVLDHGSDVTAFSRGKIAIVVENWVKKSDLYPILPQLDLNHKILEMEKKINDKPKKGGKKKRQRLNG